MGISLCMIHMMEFFKLKHTPVLLNLCGDITAKQLKRGFIEQVVESKIPAECHLFPIIQ